MATITATVIGSAADHTRHPGFEPPRSPTASPGGRTLASQGPAWPTPSTHGNGGAGARSGDAVSESSSGGASGGAAPTPELTDQASTRMPPAASLALMLLYPLLQGINLVVVIPTADDYAHRLGGDQMFAGLMISSVPVGAMIGITMCAWSLRRITFKSLMTVLAVGTILGNVLYALAGLMNFSYTLLIARFLIGLFNLFSLTSKYIGLTVGLKRRSEVVLYYSAMSTLGCAVGPALAALLDFFIKSVRIHNLVLDSDTVPGWCMAFVFSLFLVLVALLFEDPPAELIPSRTVGSAAPSGDRLPVVAVCAAFWHLCVSSAVLTTVEVYVVSLGQQHWGWSISQSAWLLAGLMLVSGMVNMGMGVLTRRFIQDDRMGLLGSSLLGWVACALLFDFRIPSVGLQVVVLGIGLMVVLTMAATGRAFALALQSKLVPTSLKGKANNWSVVFMTLGRGAGAVVGALLGTASFGPVLLATFAVSALVCALSHGRMRPSEKAD
uniref:Major facilitator superfamily (MFS) profile domain-containing protein n=1 Tax=Zooxanthella nutricula TaxID=1333877 RepID=A0A7S2IUF4_9DINO